MEPFEANWSHVKSDEAIMERYEAIWSHVKPDEAQWSLMKPIGAM